MGKVFGKIKRGGMTRKNGKHGHFDLRNDYSLVVNTADCCI
jgi:hypothetical protein